MNLQKVKESETSPEAKESIQVPFFKLNDQIVDSAIPEIRFNLMSSPSKDESPKKGPTTPVKELSFNMFSPSSEQK